MNLKPILLLLPTLMLLAGCGGDVVTPPFYPTSTPAPAATPAAGAAAGSVNIRFLISDEVNAIDQFQSLKVSIGRIGLLRGGESGKWIEMPPRTPTVDLVQL